MRERSKIGEGIFLAALVAELILAGCLIQEIAESDRYVRRMLTKEELSHYAQYQIALPDVLGREPRAEEVLAYCTPQEEKTAGSTKYRPYTSNVLPEYLYNCDCQRRYENVRKRRRNFVVFGREGDNKNQVVSCSKGCLQFAVSGA